MSAGAAVVERPSVDLAWFRRKQLRALAVLVAAVLVFQGCSMICNFSLAYAITSLPAAFVWMFQNFIPTAGSF